MSLLAVQEISRQEESGFLLQEISFIQPKFKKIAIAGATGSGKTTLLKIIAGLLQPTAGAVLFAGARVEGPDEKLIPGHTHIAYLSQHFELLNKYRVRDYLGMASRLPDEESARIYQICRIDHLLKRWTSQLSGGERQRIALARLLVGAPQLLLLDEPYSNLDAIHKNILKGVIQDLSESLELTCLLVSHDPQDVLSWAEEILVLQEGRIIQQGAPAEVYNNPVNEYAAALFGTYNRVSPALMKLFFPHSFVTLNNVNRFIRPEHFVLSRTEDSGVKGVVTQVRFMGSYFELEVLIEGHTIRVNNNGNTYKKGDVVYVALAKRHPW